MSVSSSCSNITVTLNWQERMKASLSATLQFTIWLPIVFMYDGTQEPNIVSFEVDWYSGWGIVIFTGKDALTIISLQPDMSWKVGSKKKNREKRSHLKDINTS